MKKKPSAKSRPPKPAAKRSAEIPPPRDRLLSLEFLQGRADEGENLLALERLLTRAEGFTLAFARVNMPAQRAALVQEIRRRVEPKGLTIIEINLTTPVRDLLDELRHRLQSFYGLKTKVEKREVAVAEAGPRFAVFVYGLEHSISSSAIYHSLLAVMNYKRENFREQIPGPLVLWVLEYVLQAIIEGAPDFWAWRSGVFEFAAPPAEVEKSLASVPERGQAELSRMSIEEKRNRIQLLASLLAEYESQENAKVLETAAIRADLLLRLGMLHRYLGEFPKALEYYQKSLAITREIGDRAVMIPTLHNIAHINLQSQQFQAALEAFGEAFQLARETNNAEGLFNVSRDFGNVLCMFGQKQEGVNLLQLALQVGQQIDHPNLSQVEELLRQYS